MNVNEKANNPTIRPLAIQSTKETIKALKKIISIHGNELAFWDYNGGVKMIVVAKSGAELRVWSRLDSNKPNHKILKLFYAGKPGWIPSWMLEDKLIVHPDHLEKIIAQWKFEIIDNRRLHHNVDDPQYRARTLPAHRYRLRQSELLYLVLKARQLQRWLRHFPAHSLDFTYNKGLRKQRWHLLELWTSVPSSRDIFNDCPTLAFLMATRWVFRPNRDSKQFEVIRSLCKGPRLKILQWLGFPSTPSMIKLLRNIDCQSVQLNDLGQFKFLITSRLDIIPWLLECDTPIKRKHLDFLSSLLGTRFVMDEDFLLTPSLYLFRKYLKAETLEADEIQFLLIDSLNSIKRLQDEQRLSYYLRLSRIRSKRKLSEFYHALMKSPEYLEASFQEIRAQLDEDAIKQFPLKSPFTNLPETWTPLTTVEAIRCESIEMLHCLFTDHLLDIANRKTFCFSIKDKGERATLSITKLKTRWIFDQMVRKGNAAVSQQLLNKTIKQLKRLLLENTTVGGKK